MKEKLEASNSASLIFLFKFLKAEKKLKRLWDDMIN